MKKNNGQTKPSGFDDFLVYTIRTKNKDYLSKDARFSERAMKQRSSALANKLKRRFEAAFNVK